MASIASVVSVLGASAIVGAQEGSSDQQASPETIQACADARGTLRKVDTGQSCPAGESAVAWNVQGPEGPTGQPGPAGPAGPIGSRGPKGNIRVKGDKRFKLILSENQQILLRLKIAGKKLDKLATRLAQVDGRVVQANNRLATAALLDRRTYVRTYHNCIGIQQTYTGGDPDTALFRCREGFYQGLPGFDPDAKASP